MTIEYWSIAALALMLLVVTFIQGGLVPLTQGFKWGLGSRDAKVEYSALQSRLARTVQNHSEAMLIYVPLMALAIALEQTNEMTELAAWLVIIGRIAFIPLYLLGVFGLRSLAYGVSALGIFILVWQLLV